jgi:hypothetical protein
MRGVSVFLMVVLVLPILLYSLHILALYDSNGPLKTFGFPDSDIMDMARPSIILLAIYVAALSVSIFLFVKKNYTVNVIFLSVMVSLYILMNLCHVPRVS